MALGSVFSFIFGAFIGSFLNVVILRLPLEKPITGRSHCMHCNHQLSFLDLVPLFSFIFLHGKCRYCGHRISSRYFIIEAATALLFAASYFLIGPNQAFEYLFLLKVWLVISICVVTFVVDLEHYVILSTVVLFSAVLIVLLNLSGDIVLQNPVFSKNSLWVSSILGSFLGAFPIWLLWYGSKWFVGKKGAWMGYGDIELMLFLGAAVGWKLVGVLLFISIIVGGFVSVVLLLGRKRGLKDKIPFGIFLTFGCVLTVFYGEQILSWYLALLGF